MGRLQRGRWKMVDGELAAPGRCPRPVFVVAQLRIRDSVRYQRYVARFAQVIARCNATFHLFS